MAAETGAVPIIRGSEARVGFAELFFDLIFVFAITQVSHALLYHYDLKGAAETALLLLAVWWVWIYSTWALNRLNPDHVAVRGLLFGLMAAGLFLSMAIPDAFGERGWVFGLAFAAMQVGRTVFIWVALGQGNPLRGTYTRILIWVSGAGVLWVIGGLAPPEWRFTLWSLALVVEIAGPVLAYPLPGRGRDQTTNWTIHGGHIAERCGLFIIICLGETLLVSGATFADMDWTAAGIATFLGSLVVTVGMWWVYFHIGHRRGTHQIEHAADPGRIARNGFTYLHIPIVAGIVLAAVGSERAIAHPEDAAVLAEGATILGGPLLFLLGNGLFKRSSAQWFPPSHIAGIAALAGLMLIGGWMPLMWAMILSAVVMVVVSVWEHRSLGGEA
jgi:low temperature requirement protein LtrA